jgi:RNase P/RNase MRP subunit POP5
MNGACPKAGTSCSGSSQPQRRRRTRTKQQQQQSWSRLTVRTERGSLLNDPRELETLLRCSLKHLWGDLEPHGCLVRVASASTTTHQDGDTERLFHVTCRDESVNAVRAALTLVTPPPYLESTIYRLDVIGTEQGILLVPITSMNE